MNTEEMIIAELMAGNRSGKIYIEIPASAEPAALAKQYSRLVAFNDKDSRDHCTAVEAHLRHLAMMHFDSEPVRAALSLMENAKAAAAKHRRSAAYKRSKK